MKLLQRLNFMEHKLNTIMLQDSTYMVSFFHFLLNSGDMLVHYVKGNNALSADFLRIENSECTMRWITLKKFTVHTLTSLLHKLHPERIREKYRLCRICTSHFRRSMAMAGWCGLQSTSVPSVTYQQIHFTLTHTLPPSNVCQLINHSVILII